jgi:putative transcriptional regulator
MATPKFTLDPRNPPKLSPEQEAALAAMTDEQITAAAASDPDNPPLTDGELDRFAVARVAKRVREKRRLTVTRPANGERASRSRTNFGFPRDIDHGGHVYQYDLGHRSHRDRA